jgi:hypothetical protein
LLKGLVPSPLDKMQNEVKKGMEKGEWKKHGIVDEELK